MTDVHSKGKVYVFYDLETTGFNHRTQHKEIEMVSIAAEADTGEVFTRHALPTVPMQPGASRVNGFTVVNSVLMFNGKPVSAVASQAEALVGFTAFLDEVSADKTLVLVAHNGHKLYAHKNQEASRYHIILASHNRSSRNESPLLN